MSPSLSMPRLQPREQVSMYISPPVSSLEALSEQAARVERAARESSQVFDPVSFMGILQGAKGAVGRLVERGGAGVDQRCTRKGRRE
jgi:hypothetical protein